MDKGCDLSMVSNKQEVQILIDKYKVFAVLFSIYTMYPKIPFGPILIYEEEQILFNNQDKNCNKKNHT